MRSAYLVMVEPDENHNKYYQMTQKTTDIFEVRYGRVGAKGITRKYPISRWASIYESKLQKGYVDNSHLYSPTINTRYKEIPDKAVRSFWQDIENYSKKMLERNYSVSYDKVTQEMIKEATDILKNMRNQSNVFCINGELLALFQVIPRKMKKVEDYLLKDISELPTVLEREWDLLDVMKGRMLAQQDKQNQKEKTETVLASLGLDISLVTDSCRLQQIKKNMGAESADKFARAFRVRNKKTDERFYQYMKDNAYSEKDIHYLYHGSRNENWYGLMTKGPVLRPEGVIITGKAFGNGIYFAPRAKKSIGYSSLLGSYWTGGTQHKGYLAVYKVLFKNQKDVDVSHPYSLRNIKPHDAVYAHKGVSLRNDEVIIFQRTAGNTTIYYRIKYLKRKGAEFSAFFIKILIFLLYNKNSQFHNWLFLLYNNLHGIRFFLFLFFFVLFCIAAKRIIFIKKIFFLLFIKDMFKSNNSCCSDNCTD